MDEHGTVLDKKMSEALKFPEGSVLFIYHCPNARGMFDAHDPIPCPNCEAEVPGPDFHFDWLDDLLGSGSWTCTSKYEREQLSNVFSNLTVQLHDKGQ